MKKPTLANAELAVMDLLWDSGAMTARQIRERLYPDADKAQHGTVQRLLQRLEEKDCVSRDRAAGVHMFAATLDRRDYAAGQMESLAEKLTGGSIAPLITHLVETQKLDRDEIDALRTLLDEHREQESQDQAQRSEEATK